METELRAMLALMVADREERLTGVKPTPTEIVLVEAGIPVKDAATLTGKKYGAVAKAVQRYRGRRLEDADDAT